MGCAADWIGNLFWLLQTKYPGGNVKERVRQLWMDIDAAYKRDDDRLQNLTDKMIKQEKKAPKLRCSGAQCRTMVPIATRLAESKLDPTKPLEQAALIGTQKLEQCYMALSADSVFSADLLRTQSVEFALQYVALDKFYPGTFAMGGRERERERDRDRESACVAKLLGQECISHS